MAAHQSGKKDLREMVAELRQALEACNPASNRDEWAYAAFRLGTALAETAGSIEAFQEPIKLLGEASRVFSADRAPVEHGRIATVLGSCFRRVGKPDTALSHMEAAARLLRSRVSMAEHAAAESNLATALMESGNLNDALIHAEIAVHELSKIQSPTDVDERSLIAALFNRGLIRQSLGGDPDEVLADFRLVIELGSGDDAILQRGMAHHAIGVSHKAHKLHAEGLREFALASSLLSPASFPLKHAICRFNMGITYEELGTPPDLRLALRELSVALTIFDQRLHASQRSVTLEARTRVIDALVASSPKMTISDHQVQMLLESDADSQLMMLREILGGLESLPQDVRSGVLLDLFDSMVAIKESKKLLSIMIPVLMEFPDAVLSDALSALVAALREHSRQVEISRDLDDVVHAVLHGPQRVRVRDILEYFGWQRP
jgi:tetratricopeptide (TPR) repeat protein